MAQIPLATRMRPQTLDEVVGQRHLIGEGKPLTTFVQSKRLPSMVLWGPAGSGKTTLAYLLGKAVGGELVQLSAVASGVADARKVMQQAKGLNSFRSRTPHSGHFPGSLRLIDTRQSGRRDDAPDPPDVRAGPPSASLRIDMVLPSGQWSVVSDQWLALGPALITDH